MNFKADCLATGIGSVPTRDPEEGVALVFDNFAKIPFWPQLPHRDFKESMYAQYSEPLPGLSLENEKVVLRKEQAFDGLEAFYEKYLSEDLDPFQISGEFAASLEPFWKREDQLRQAAAIKGHITGPISFGLMVTFEDKRAVIYDDTLRDVIVKSLSRQAQWQESLFKKFNENTIIFMDEPYMSSFGSAFINLKRDEVVAIFNEVCASITGLSAIHCCGNTDWGVLIDSDIDIINLDAFDCADMLLLYPDRLKQFLLRGGIIAWGIVPTLPEKITPGAAPALAKRMEEIFVKVAGMGVDLEQVVRQALITPSCGVGSLTPALAQEVFAQTAAISRLLRKQYNLAD